MMGNYFWKCFNSRFRNWNIRSKKILKKLLICYVIRWKCAWEFLFHSISDYSTFSFTEGLSSFQKDKRMLDIFIYLKYFIPLLPLMKTSKGKLSPRNATSPSILLLHRMHFQKKKNSKESENFASNKTQYDYVTFPLKISIQHIW